MSRLQDIDTRLDAIRSAVAEFAGTDQLSDEDQQTWDDMLEEAENLYTERGPLAEEDARQQAARAERMEKLLAVAGNPANREGPTLTRGPRNPFADFDMQRMGQGLYPASEVISRAESAVERAADLHQFGYDYSHDRAEEVTRKLERCSDKERPKLAAHIMRTGSDEYMDAYRSYMRDPLSQVSRAAMTLVGVNGGYLLPYVLDPTIILTNAGSANPYRRISNVKSTTSNAWQGVSSAGVNAAWIAEGTAAASDQSPTVGQVQIVPRKASAWVLGSYEVFEDTNFGDQLPELFADARDRLEESGFAAGNGTAPNPQGISTVAGLPTANNGGAVGAFAAADVYAAHAALPPRFRASPKAAWVAHVGNIDRFRSLDTAGGASFWTNLGKGNPESLVGAPIYESDSLPNATTTGSIAAIFGDWNQFLIVDRVGVSVIYEPIIRSTSNNNPTGQGGWYMFWRTGSGVSTTSAFVALTRT